MLAGMDNSYVTTLDKTHRVRNITILAMTELLSAAWNCTILQVGTMIHLLLLLL